MQPCGCSQDARAPSSRISGRLCPTQSLGGRDAEEMVAILCWHFISVPVSALPLSSAPAGQRCTQLKSCNSLSGI